MARMPLTVEQILSVLAETPKRLAALTVDLTPPQLRTAPGPDEWSANEVLAHLRSCADVWGDCISRMLAEEHPTLRAIDPRAWTERTNYPELEFERRCRHSPRSGLNSWPSWNRCGPRGGRAQRP